MVFLAKWKALSVGNPLSMRYRFDSWYCQFICFEWWSVMLDWFKPALNGQMEKYGKGKQGGCTKAQDFWSPALHCNSWPQGHKVEISTASLDLDVSVLPYLLTCILVLSLHTFYLHWFPRSFRQSPNSLKAQLVLNSSLGLSDFPFIAKVYCCVKCRYFKVINH